MGRNVSLLGAFFFSHVVDVASPKSVHVYGDRRGEHLLTSSEHLQRNHTKLLVPVVNLQS